MKTTLFIIFILPLSACGMLLPKAELEVRVLDEDKKPIQNAEVIAWFPHIYGAGASPKGESFQVQTNTEGTVVLKEKTSGLVSFGVRKSDYYETAGGKVDFMAMQNRGEDRSFSAVVLKKIRNPIPMYSRLLREMKMPALNAPFGFDLEVGDWVAPHGRVARRISYLKSRDAMRAIATTI